MIKKLMIYWFRFQAAKSARITLALHFNKNEIRDILLCYWRKYLKLKPDVPIMLTLGSSLMVHLAAMSAAFYQELIGRGQSEKISTQLFYDIAWEVYQKMGKFSWWIAGLGNCNGYKKLLKATKLIRFFPFSSPSYQWKEITSKNNVVGFDCLKCPVADYFQQKGLSEFCTKTWCALDFPLAEMWNAKLERTGSIAGGVDKCDFRWKVRTSDK